MMKLTYIIGLIVVLVLITAQGCQKAETPVTIPTEPTVVIEPVEEATPSETYVRILRNGFDPDVITIPQGGTVIWKNMDDRTHLVLVINDGERSPRLEKGDVWDKTFMEPETYEIMDAIFKFRGEVIVEIS